MKRLRYIHNLLEYRRYTIMYDIVSGNKVPEFQKLKGDDLKIAKALARGEYDDIMRGQASLSDVLVQPNNTNRPPKK
jgi:hypothetical protein